MAATTTLIAREGSSLVIVRIEFTFVMDQENVWFGRSLRIAVLSRADTIPYTERFRCGEYFSSGPSREWVETKAMAEGEFVVVGVEPNPGGPPFALLSPSE